MEEKLSDLSKAIEQEADVDQIPAEGWSKAHILRTALHNLKTFLPVKERRRKTNFTS